MRSSPRILFHTHSARALTSSLIGHLYELSQAFPVVVLADALPAGYRRLLEDARVFPGIERVHEASTLGHSPGDLFRRNREWWRLAGEAIDTYRPDLVVAENDMSALFDMYLLRQARLRGVRRLTLQSMAQIRSRNSRAFKTAQHVYGRTDDPGALGAAWRRTVAAARKNAAHALVHYVLPWSIGQRALGGRSSYVRVTGAPGMRDSQLHVVQNVQQYRTCVDSGVSPRRLAVLAHPVTRVPRDVFFPDTAGGGGFATDGRPVMLALLPNTPIGIDRETGRVIRRADRRRIRLEAIEALIASLPGWRLVVKAHPDFGSVESVRAYLGALADAVEIVEPARPVEPLLASCNAVIDLPSPATTTLATAAAAFPALPVVAADLDGDVIGDHYAEWPEIETVRTIPELIRQLGLIRAGRFERRAAAPASSDEYQTFRDTAEAAEHALAG